MSIGTTSLAAGRLSWQHLLVPRLSQQLEPAFPEEPGARNHVMAGSGKVAPIP